MILLKHPPEGSDPMDATRKNPPRTLPPSVTGGNCSGCLDLSFDKIQWNVTVTSYADLRARIVWWGESYDEATCVQLSPTDSSLNRVQYKIFTNSSLFRKYLSNCEAIEIQFSSGAKRQLGTSFISIPEVLLDENNEFKGPVAHKSTHKIFSPRNHTVGTLKVTMKLVLFEDLTKAEDPFTERNTKKNYLMSIQKTPPAIRSESVLSSSKVWSFLRGREMSPRDEETTLRELTVSSPANSVIEAMDEELLWKLKDFRSKQTGKNKSQRNPEISSCHNNSSNSGSAKTPVIDLTGTATRSSNGRSESAGGSERNGQESNSNGEKQMQSPESESTANNLIPEDYEGVFYVGSFRPQNPHTLCPPNVFAMAKSVSNVPGSDGLMKTNLSDPQLFVNYLKVFPIHLNESHLEVHMKQGSLAVELWTRSGESDEKLGAASVNLHPFYVAFRHSIVRQRLFDLSMPVIALDGWAMVQGPDGATIGELELILAMGTRQQIDYFVKTKHLMQRQPPTPTSTRSTTTSILSSFLDNLSQQIAASKSRQNEEHSPAPQKGELRKTSDLLDALQKSFAAPPPTMMNNLFAQQQSSAVANRDSTDGINGSSGEEFIKISLEIECAMHLPKIAKTDTKKRNTSKKAKEQEPSAYVTFEAKINENNTVDIVDSVEGQVYATRVIERSSNPAWNQSFTVEIPKDLLTHSEKYFIVKIWRKRGSDGEDLQPKPLEDVVVGFCTVDLKVLTAGLPEIAGCYNIVYFDGKCNGQLQLKLKPLEEVQHRDVLDKVEMQQKNGLQSALQMLDLSMTPDLSLSRTLKRKFTELDEITERLRARLHNVTSSELISSDDEFENDLNTSVDEVDEEQVEVEEQEGDVVDAVKDDFNWLGNLTAMQRQFVEIDRQLQSNSQTLNDLLDRNGFQRVAVAGPSGTQSAKTTYTNGGEGGSGDSGASAAVESLETALKGMWNDGSSK